MYSSASFKPGRWLALAAALLGLSPLVVSAATINVNSNAALTAALAAANPGDAIILADGTYAGFTMSRDGTSANPITIAAANLGGATISSGVIRLEKTSYVTLKGLRITTPGGAISIQINGNNYPAAVWLEETDNCRVTQCILRLSGHARYTQWILISGNSNYNRVDHNEFGPNTVQGHMVWPYGTRDIAGVTPPADRTSWANGNGPVNPNMARHTRIDHNHFYGQGAGTGEVVVMGAMGVTGDYQNTYTVFENNLVENCDGDAELICSKSSSNTIRNNTIRNCRGMLSSRAGNNCTITGNIMLQGGVPGSAGIKIYERNHIVTGNYVDNPADYAYLMGAGDAYGGGSFTHAASVNCVMNNNIGINLNVRAAIIGHGGSGVAPSGCSFSNNQLRGSVSPLITLRSVGNTVISGNTTSGSNPAMPGTPLTAGDVGPAATSYTLPSPFAGFYRIMARHSGKAVVVQGASLINSANVVQYTYGGSATNDEWQLADVGDGYHSVLNRNSNLALVVQSASTANGANIIQYTFGGSSTNDEWQVIDNGGGYYRIINHNSGKALTVAGASTSNNAALQQSTWTGATNQQFQIISVP
jgi:hypothetical protein